MTDKKKDDKQKDDKQKGKNQGEPDVQNLDHGGEGPSDRRW